MVRQVKPAIGMVLLALFALAGMARPASAQTRSPIEVAQALADAQNANDPAAMRALIASNALFVNDPSAGGPTEGREQWIFHNTGANNSHVTVSNKTQTSADTVTADAVLSGGDIPPQLAHPFLVHVTFTVANGQITHAVILTDPQTLQDLQTLLGPPPPGGGSEETASPADIVLALTDAQNQNNAAAMRARLAPAATIVQDPLFGGSENRDQFIADNTGANNSTVAVMNVQQTAPDTVKADAVLSGGQVPPLPHPFLLHATFTVANGQVTHAVVNVDAQTRKDLAALGPPPGMPSTGQGIEPALAILGLGAAGLALAGMLIRLRRTTR